MSEGMLRPDTSAWIQAEADAHFDGNWGQTAAAILEAAHEAEQHPDQLWRYLEARQRGRSWRRPQPPGGAADHTG